MQILLYSGAALVASFAIYKFLNRKKQPSGLFHVVKAVYRPLYVKLMGRNPIVVNDLDMIIRDRIELSLYNRINSAIYRNHIINKEVHTQIDLVFSQENFMPLSYQEGFNRLYKQTAVKVASDFEKAGYDIEIDVGSGRIILVIRPKIRNLVKK